MNRKKTTPSSKPTNREKSRQRATSPKRKTTPSKKTITPLIVQPVNRVKKQQSTGNILQTLVRIQVSITNTNAKNPVAIRSAAGKERTTENSGTSACTTTTVDSASSAPAARSSNNVSQNSRGRPTARLVQKYILIWVDADIDDSKEYYRHSLSKLQRVVNTIMTFTDFDECIDFVKTIPNE